MGHIETLIIWENFDTKYYFSPHNEEKKHITDFEWEFVEEMSLIEWLYKKHKQLGKKKDQELK